MNHKTKTIPYNILKDKHMYYYLQSATKVKQLILSGLYQLNGNVLIDIQTKQTVQLDQCIIENVKEINKKVKDRNVELEQIVNSQKFKLFQEERERLKRMKENKSLENSRISKTNVQFRDIPKIKGLKQFMKNKLK